MTSFNAPIINSFPMSANPVWLKIRDDGATVYFYVGLTGDDNDFLLLYSVAKVSSFLGASGYSNVCFFSNSHNAMPVYSTLMSWTQGT